MKIQIFRTKVVLVFKYVPETRCLTLKEEYRKGCLSTRCRRK